MSRRLLVYGDPPPVAAGLDASNATAPNTTEPAAPESATPRPFRLSPVPGGELRLMHPHSLRTNIRGYP